MTSRTADTSPRSTAPSAARTRHQALAVATAFFALFSIVGFAFYGLPFFYDFFVKELGWSRAQVTSGNAFAKLVIGPLFGFFAGVFVDRFGPRRLMLFGILLAGLAPIAVPCSSERIFLIKLAKH